MEKVFENFIGLVGKEDKSDRIRISLIEGQVPKQDNGYFVVIGESPSATAEVISTIDKKSP